MVCKVCGKAFHYCNSCSPEPENDAGYCSITCAIKELPGLLRENGDEDEIMYLAAEAIDWLVSQHSTES